MELSPDCDVIVGLDARGFLFGTPLSLSLKKPFVPVRKKGKLPGEVKQLTYTLEYGKVSIIFFRYEISQFYNF